LSAAFSLLLFSTISSAQVSIYVSNANFIISSSSTQTVDITVQNTGPQDRFSVRVFPPFIQSGNGQVTANLDKSVATIDQNQNATFELTFSAQPCIADYITNIFTVTASSLVNSATQANVSIRVTTLRTFPVCIAQSQLSSDTLIPGQTLTVTATIDNPSDLASTSFDLITSIRNSSDIVVLPASTNHVDIIQPHSSKIITNNYVIPQTIGYGRFSVELVLQNSQTTELSSQHLSFVVQQFENPITQKTIQYGLLTQNIFLKIRNDGNSVVNATTSEIIPTFMRTFVSFVDKPDAEQTVGNNFIYIWIFYNLQPGEERTVEYQINLWQIVLLGVIIIIAVAYAFTYVFTIRIIKKHKLFGPLAGSKEILITLEARNRTAHPIHDVYVRDFLPAFATVVERFETVKPTVSKALGGTELVWKLGTLRSMDERVLTYRIKPTMQILGEIKLPKAIIGYSGKNKELKKTVSKTVSIKV